VNNPYEFGPFSIPVWRDAQGVWHTGKAPEGNEGLDPRLTSAVLINPNQEKAPSGSVHIAERIGGTLPLDAKARKDIPLFRGLLKYFPRACAAVAELSRIGNEQHNPGSPMHWDRTKSQDHGDCVVRHQVDAGTFDADDVRHSTKVAWRAMAQLEVELEEAEKTGGGPGISEDLGKFPFRRAP